MGVRQKINLCLTFAVVVVFSGTVKANELSCPSYWSDSLVEVLVTIPLAAVPPGGKDLFLLNPPNLQGVQANSSDEVADETDLDSAAKTLHAIFCDVEPDQVQRDLVVKIGPKIISIPATQQSKRKMPTGRIRISARSPGVITPDWIAPTKVNFQAPTKGERESLTVQFVAPAGMKIDTKSLKVSLLSDFSRCRNITYSSIPLSKRLSVPCRVRVGLGDNAPRTYDATFYPTFQCGPPAIVEFDLGPFKNLKSSGYQEIALHIYNIEVSSNDLLPASKWCANHGERCTGLSVYTEAVGVELKESNVYPQSFMIRRKER